MDPTPHPEQARALTYLRRKGTEATAESLRGRLRPTCLGIETLFAAVAASERDRSPAAGQWSPHEILDHLVLSHRPAADQLRSLLAGETPGGVAIPAGLISRAEERRGWSELLAELADVHRNLEGLAAEATDELSLLPRAVVEMVVKVPAEDGTSQPVHWFEELDWKAFLLAIRVHILEHHRQLARTLEILRSSAALPSAKLLGAEGF